MPKLKLFSRRDYSSREKYRPDYLVLARALVETVDFATQLDVGCGQGFLMQPLHEAHGKTVQGIEYSRESERFVAPSLVGKIAYGSFVDMPVPGRFDLVSCVEVVEHIPAERADDAVKFLTTAATKWIYLAAAIPKQPGVGHINCQPTSYWLRKLDAHGWELDLAKTGQFIDKLAAISICYWLPQNALIFRPKS